MNKSGTNLHVFTCFQTKNISFHKLLLVINKQVEAGRHMQCFRPMSSSSGHIEQSQPGGNRVRNRPGDIYIFKNNSDKNNFKGDFSDE